MAKNYLLVSCWNEHLGRPGMALLRYDPATGAVEDAGIQNPDLSCNCSVFNPATGVLYITNEVHENPDYIRGGGGLIYAFRFDRDTGTFTQLSRVEASCPCPAYLSLDATGRYLLCACHSSFNAVTKAVKGEDGYWHTKVEYDDAIIGLFRLNEDGSIGPLVDVKKHDRYPVMNRGLHSHPHTAAMSPDGSLFACCDKGDNHIYFYTLDYEHEALVLTCEPYEDKTGNAPRYCVYHPVKPWFFCNHERSMTVSAFHYTEKGELTLINTANAIPETGITDPHDTATVREALHGVPAAAPADGLWPLEQQGFVISADGKYLYSALNGADAVTVLEIDQKDGSVRRIQTMAVNGRWVRGCTLSPDGRFLAVAAHQSGGIYIYPVLENGLLGAPVSRADVDGGSYLTFI